MDDSNNAIDDALSFDNETDNWTSHGDISCYLLSTATSNTSNRTFSGHDYTDDLLTCSKETVHNNKSFTDNREDIFRMILHTNCVAR